MLGFRTMSIQINKLEAYVDCPLFCSRLRYMIMKSKFVPYILSWGIVILASVIISLGKPNGWDFFWYLGAGQLMHDTANVGETFTATGAVWHNHEWLFHWIMGLNPNPGIFHFVLHIALVFAVMVSLFMLTLRRCQSNPMAAAFWTLIAGLLMSSFLILRAQMASYILFILLIGILESSMSEKNKALWIAPLMLIWANLHGAFVLGIALVFLHVGNNIFITKKNSEKPKANWYLPLIVAMLIPLINPNFIEIYTYPLKWIGNSIYKDSIREWQSVLRWDFLLYPYVAYSIVAAIIMYFGKPNKLIDYIMLLAFALFPLTAVRHLPLYFIVATPIVFDSSMRIDSYLEDKLKKSVLIGNGKWIFLLLVLFAHLGFHLNINPVTRITDPIYAKYAYPTGATAFMRDNNLDGRIFNAYQWGGYLWLNDFDIFIDGRLDTLYPENVFLDYQNVVKLESNWQEILDKWNIDYLLFHTRTDDNQSPALISAAVKSDNFHLVYMDPVATLFVNAESVNPVFLDRLKSGQIPIPDEPMCQYAAGMALYNQGGNENMKTAMQHLERALILDPAFAQPHLGLAKLMIQQSDYETAMKHIKSARRLGLRSGEIDELYEIASAGI